MQLYEVASGVEYIHSRNPPICHGDLKSVSCETPIAMTMYVVKLKPPFADQHPGQLKVPPGHYRLWLRSSSRCQGPQ